MAASTLPGWEQYRQQLALLRNEDAITEEALLPLIRAGRALAVAAFDHGADKMLDEALQEARETSR